MTEIQSVGAIYSSQLILVESKYNQGFLFIRKYLSILPSSSLSLKENTFQILFDQKEKHCSQTAWLESSRSMKELTAKKFSWFFRVSLNSLLERPMMPMESTCSSSSILSSSSTSSSSSSLSASLRSLQRSRYMS